MIVLVCYFWQPVVGEHVYCAEMLRGNRVAQSYHYNGRYNQMMDMTHPLGWQLWEKTA